MIGYIVFSTQVQRQVTSYEIPPEAIFSSTFDHLPVIVNLNIDLLHILS